MSGKVCLITGATAGLGKAGAGALALLGAEVVIAGRNPEKAAATVREITEQSGNPHVEALLADLSVQKEVRRLAAEFKEKYDHLHVLINNAGGIFLKRQESADGLELTFALNHLAPFLLTNLLLETLKASAPARIVNVASKAHETARINFADLQTKQNYRGFRVYGESKLANVLFTYELDRRLSGTDVTANALHPGLVATSIAANNGTLARAAKPFVNLFSINPAKGARTIVYLATSPEVESVSGAYFFKQRTVLSSKASHNLETAERLWQVSEELTELAPKDAPDT
jgi:NAD(P)-dependent dehydrogenase (short-subunit alcohol dehydrogenase family)